MSSHDHATAAAIAHLVTVCDGAVLGLSLAYLAAISWVNYLASSSALRRIRNAPSVLISDLRSLLSSAGNSSAEDEGRLVVVRGQASPYSIFQAIFGKGYPVALLDETKILPVGKVITAVGICKAQNGALDLKSCKDLPCFLSDTTKDEIEADLTINTSILFWSGVLLGTLSTGILGYSVIRKWLRWQEIRKRRQNRESLGEDQLQSSGDKNMEVVPDGELCVICLTRRRRSAFVPCGHHVCYSLCAMSVQLRSSPKCPVCQQSIQSSIRIYDS